MWRQIIKVVLREILCEEETGASGGRSVGPSAILAPRL
jgi:hypothetical protein